MTRLFDQVAQAPNGADHDARRFDLAAQAVHEDLDGVRPDFVTDTIQAVGQLILADHAPGTQKKCFEQGHLACRQLERIAADERPSGGRVERQCAMRDTRGGGALAAILLASGPERR